MRTTRYTLPIIVCLIATSLFAAVPAWAVSRTTPVEVMNSLMVGIESGNNTVQAVQRDPWYVGITGTPNFNVANSPTVKIDGTTNTVKIDGTTNTVKAAQSGTWNVGITGTPSVAQSGTWNVGVTGTPSVAQSGAWNVGITGTPAVSVSNSPTVKIDSTANTVDAPAKHSMIQLWATNQAVASGANLYSANINCAGYREVRALLWSSSGGLDLHAYVTFQGPTGLYLSIVSMTWSSGNIVTCQCPVFSDNCRIEVFNGTGGSINIMNGSYVYLLN